MSHKMRILKTPKMCLLEKKTENQASRKSNQNQGIRDSYLASRTSGNDRFMQYVWAHWTSKIAIDSTGEPGSGPKTLVSALADTTQIGMAWREESLRERERETEREREREWEWATQPLPNLNYSSP